MKCPKCGFISFDYNEACPKCGGDLSRVRELMNFPSYQPKPLSLLGVLTGGADMAASDAVGGTSGGPEPPGGGTEEMVISLEAFSDEDQSPIQFEPAPAAAGPEPIMEKGEEGLDNELTISLDDLSDESEDLVRFDAEPEFSTPEPDVLDGIVFEPETISDEEPLETGFWEAEAVGQESAEGLTDDAVPVTEAVPSEEASADKEKEGEQELFELELEPLELDLDMDEPDKKTS